MNIGIDIGGSHIAIGLIDDNMKIVIKKEHNWTKEEKLDYFKYVEIYSKKLIKEILEETQVAIKKIGIGYPAGNIVNGVIYKYNKELPLASILSKEFGVPVYLKNDVKCSAICEKHIGNLKEYDNCIFITLGTGIGGAYFYKNKLVIPNKYQGFEVGHMIIEKEGRQCRCGNKGCFEEYGSMRVFRTEIEKIFGIEKVTSDIVFELIERKEKEEEVNKVIDNYVEDLSIGIANLVNIFEPDAICIGGSFTYYANIFIEKLKENVSRKISNKLIPDIVIAKFENDAGIIGASMLESN